ncbi:hypothetical protein [Paenibacillus xylanivorans]|uniref:hypothetical protein n=1 Tax=Paenibacillus xylanivorans TaxID=1705561 RepID=UPI000B0EFC58|nr:hypothetical protein [Paenibacillus xylanivorans]
MLAGNLLLGIYTEETGTYRRQKYTALKKGSLPTSSFLKQVRRRLLSINNRMKSAMYQPEPPH